jgi:ATP-binding cassette, subfamily F, member 1
MRHQRQLWPVQVGGNKEKMREQSAKVERNQAKQAQKGAGKGNKNKGMMVDDGSTDATAKPKKWNDYNVKFTFPEPTELNSAQLLQLIDADFKYAGRDDFGMHDMNVGIGMGSRVRASQLRAPLPWVTRTQAATRAPQRSSSWRSCRDLLQVP